jgi:pyruvate,water dikinase
MTPMEIWLWKNGVAGGDRAWDEVGMIAPPVFQRFQLAGPFLYALATPPSPELLMKMAPRVVAVAAEYGTALAFWKEYCEPRIVRSCDELTKLGRVEELKTGAETWYYGFHQTFTSLSLIFIPSMRLGGMLTELFGASDAELLGNEVTQGGENATQEIDFAIWELAELARTTPAAARILASDGSDLLEKLRKEPGTASFVKAFDALIARYGRRSQGWSLIDETWAERPEAALALVRAQLGAEGVSPDELRHRSEQARQVARDKVLAALPEGRHAEFHSIVKELEGYVHIREGRAYWQLVICGDMRGAVLRAGTELVAQGRIDRADDVFFVTPDDVADRRAPDLRARVDEARKEWERWRRIQPPTMIGTPGEASATAEEKRAEHRGKPASRGTVTGPARIIANPEDGARMQPGDIMVCVMTTPAWTPLFALASGIVTETGGALSHPAITAREYGIPAVVALEGATTRFKDGQLITVDGAAGTVTAAG